MVEGDTLKSLSDTRWECRVKSIRAVLKQAPKICDALEEVISTAPQAKHKVEAESLVNNIRDFKFLVCLTMWHDMLQQINLVSKALQQVNDDISHGLVTFQKMRNWLLEYRDSGYQTVLLRARNLATELAIEPDFKQKRTKWRTAMFDYESTDTPIQDAEVQFEVTCFNYITDKALTELEDHFEDLKVHHQLFGVLTDFRQMNEDEIKARCKTLEEKLAYTAGESDIDAQVLNEELKVIAPMIPREVVAPIEILQHLAAYNRCEVFPNYYNAPSHQLKGVFLN